MKPSLDKSPFEFEFFQAVRLLERSVPESEVVGTCADPLDEVVRFQTNPQLVFPPTEIQSLKQPQKREASESENDDFFKGPTMVVNFMGLIGYQGVLPIVYSVEVLKQVRATQALMPSPDDGNRGAFLDFLDLFSHRILSLYYLAWRKYRFTVAYERGEADAVTRQVLDFLGLGTQSLQRRQSINDECLVYYAGLLACRPISEAVIQQVVSDAFNVSVEIEQFAGGWYELPEDAVTRMLEEPLGSATVIGNQVCDPTAAVRLRLGPLMLAEYLNFLPMRVGYKRIRSLLAFTCGTELDFELELVLDRKETPRCVLGTTGIREPLLGWTTWSISKESLDHDPSDTVIRM